MVKVPVLFSFPLTPALQFAKRNEPWDLAYFQIQPSTAVAIWALTPIWEGRHGWDGSTTGVTGKAPGSAAPGMGRVWPCKVPSVLWLQLTSQPHAIKLPLVLESPWIYGERLRKLIKIKPFIGVSGLLLFGSVCGARAPGLCYKSYCMSGASQNPTPIIPSCWKPPERKKWGRGAEKEGEFGLPLVKSYRSSFHLLAEAVHLE